METFCFLLCLMHRYTTLDIDNFVKAFNKYYFVLKRVRMPLK